MQSSVLRMWLVDELTFPAKPPGHRRQRHPSPTVFPRNVHKKAFSLPLLSNTVTRASTPPFGLLSVRSSARVFEAFHLAMPESASLGRGGLRRRKRRSTSEGPV